LLLLDRLACGKFAATGGFRPAGKKSANQQNRVMMRAAQLRRN
jgi:hypothetical protein